jgi:hypothetical protein
MKIILTTFISLLLCAAIFAQKTTPEFDQYPVKVEKATAKTVNLKSHKMARMFRTSLRESLKGGVNFAGKFVVSVTGCGTGCIQARIINAKTGAVYFPEPLMGVSWTSEIGDAEMLDYKKNSRLLIVNGYVASGKKDTDGYDVMTEEFGTWYYEWTGTNLKLIKFVKMEPLVTDDEGDGEDQ